MAVANLQETLLYYTLRKSNLIFEMDKLQGQKRLAVAAQSDISSLMSANKQSIRDYYRSLYEENPDQYSQYSDYTKIPEFETEIDRITTMYQDQLDEQAQWEEMLDAQITTDSTELEEINSQMDSYRQMLSSNIQDDFGYGLGS